MSFRSAIQKRPLTPDEEQAICESYREISTFAATSYGLSREIKGPLGDHPRLWKRSKHSNELVSLRRDIGNYLLLEDQDVLSVVFGAVPNTVSVIASRSTRVRSMPRASLMRSPVSSNSRIRVQVRRSTTVRGLNRSRARTSAADSSVF